MKRLLPLLCAVVLLGAGCSVGSFGSDSPTQRVEIEIENVAPVSMAAGVYVVHDETVSLDLLGYQSPLELAEYVLGGDTERLVAYYSSMDGVYEVFTVDPLEVNGVVKWRGRLPQGASLSGLHYVTGTDDTYAFFDAVSIDSEDELQSRNDDAGVYQNGSVTDSDVTEAADQSVTLLMRIE